MDDPIERRFDPAWKHPEWGAGRPGRTPERFAAHDAIATYRDMATARRVVQALQFAAIDASQISLYGAAAERAAGDLAVRAADEGFARVMWTRTWKGGLVGAILGGVFGAVIAAVVLSGAGPGSTGVFWAAVVGTAVLGLGTGAATGATSAAQMSRAWELTFHDVDEGEVGVAIHTDDPDEASRAWNILARHDPRQLEHFTVDPPRE